MFIFAECIVSPNPTPLGVILTVGHKLTPGVRCERSWDDNDDDDDNAAADDCADDCAEDVIGTGHESGKMKKEKHDHCEKDKIDSSPPTVNMSCWDTYRHRFYISETRSRLAETSSTCGAGGAKMKEPLYPGDVPFSR